MSFDDMEIQGLIKKYGDDSFLDYCRMFRLDKIFVKAQGMLLWDSQGKIYRDFLGGYGCLNLGHEHPAVIKALRDVEGMPNMAQFGLNPFQAQLSQMLASISPSGLTRSVFTNSGAETAEAAIKTACAFTGREMIAYAVGAYHGKTLGALAITDNYFYRSPFKSAASFSSQVAFNDVTALERALKKRTFAAFIVEPIQGEGGISIPGPDYLRVACDLCKKYGTIFILDEIQTGLGRTGRMFCADHFFVSPDILLISKSLSGGAVPIGAMMMTEKIWQKVYAGVRNCGLTLSTFGGNTRACACAIAAIEVIRSENLSKNAEIMGERLINGLREIAENVSWIKDVRGSGLMIGIEINIPFGRRVGSLIASSLCAYFLDNYGIILGVCLNNRMVVRVEPPLVISNDDVEYFLVAFREFCARYKNLGMLGVLAKKFVVNYVNNRRINAVS